MHRLLAIVLFGLLMCGFALPETPEERAVQEKEGLAWKRSFIENFDLSALRSFLKAQITANAVKDGVDLRKSKVNRKWHFGGLGVSCGDWSFSTKVIGEPDFSLWWNYEDVPRPDGTFLQRSIVFKCRRESKTVFTLRFVERIEEENVVLMP